MQGSGEPSWGSADVVANFSTAGYSDEGEKAAFATVDAQRVGEVLDLGVGGGRTTGLLAPSARAYTGIDLTPAMIALARQRFAGVDLRIGNARDLAGLPDGRFDLVVFSFNGLDALQHDDRLAALASMARVLAPEGRVLFSSLNLDGISYGERPWRLRNPTSARSRWHLAQAVRHPGSAVRSVQNYRRSRALVMPSGPGWAMAPLRAHEFRFVVHFASLGETVREARQAGLEVVSAHADTGEPVEVAAAHTRADYVHYVCRRARS